MKTTYVRTNVNGEISYMTPAAYEEFRLQLSTGDFHTHKKTVLKKLPKSVPTYMVRDAVYYNPRLAYPTVESIIEAYNNEDASAEEYSTSEDSPLAEFVSTFFYGEIEISQLKDSSRLEDATYELLKQHWEKLGRKATLELLKSACELKLGNIYYQDGEICGGVIGEQEHQVDDTLSEAFQTLTPEEREQVIKATSAGLYSSGRQNGQFIYTSDDYYRWIMVVENEDKLCRKIRKALEAQGGAK